MATYKDFPVIIVDASENQDNPGTAYQPTLDKLKAAGVRGTAFRVGYGIVLDRMFKYFWERARRIFERKPYFYGDYYSHKNTGTTDTEWGEEQAYTAYDALKDDPGEMPLALDCEECGYGGRITLLNRASYNRVMKAFCLKYDQLTGGKTEIYTAPGFLWVFDDWAKDRTLWIAWYNRSITLDQIIAKVKASGWRGKVIIWQYASDGDINNDGIADGLALGMETKGLDLNVFLGTEAEYSVYSGSTAPYTTPVETEDPQPPIVISGVKNGTVVSSVNVRNGVGTSASQYYINGSPLVLLKGETFPVYETAYDSRGNPWLRIGYKEWVCAEYNGIKLAGLS